MRHASRVATFSWLFGGLAVLGFAAPPAFARPEDAPKDAPKPAKVDLNRPRSTT